MKWLKRISVGLVLIFFALWLIVRITTNYSTAKELEDLFSANKEIFRRAAEVLTEVLSKHDDGININTKNFYADSADDRLVIEKIEKLYFVSVNEHYTQEEYLQMYDVVDELFSSLELWGIAGTGQEVTFCVSLSAGVESDIIYRADGTPPTVLQTVKEQSRICDGWYAVITHD